MNSLFRSVLLLLIPGLLLSLCGMPGAYAQTTVLAADAATSATGKAANLGAVSVQLNWFPEAEHGGFYDADVRGLYRARGVEVKLVAGGPNVPVIPVVGTGRIAFGVANAEEIILAREQGVPVVALFAPIQDTPACIMVHEKTGIRKFQDLRDVTLAMQQGSPFNLFVRKKLTLEGVKHVPYSGNVSQFLLDEKFAQQGYAFSEPFVARKKGASVHVLKFGEIGFNPYTSVLFTTEKMIEEKPELVRAMVEASAEGWKNYISNPLKAHQKIRSQNPQMDNEILNFGANVLADLVLTAEVRKAGVGTMTAARWKELHDALVEVGLAKAGAVQVDSVFTTRFLPAPAPATVPATTAK